MPTHVPSTIYSTCPHLSLLHVLTSISSIYVDWIKFICYFFHISINVTYTVLINIQNYFMIRTIAFCSLTYLGINIWCHNNHPYLSWDIRIHLHISCWAWKETMKGLEVFPMTFFFMPTEWELNRILLRGLTLHRCDQSEKSEPLSF